MLIDRWGRSQTHALTKIRHFGCSGRDLEQRHIVVAELERGRLGDDRADLAVAIDDAHAFDTGAAVP